VVFFLVIIGEAQTFFNHIKSIDDGLSGVYPTLVVDDFFSHFNVTGTERTRIEVLIELGFAKVVRLTVLVENLDEELLRYKRVFPEDDVRRFQEVVESTRNHSDLLLDFLEIVGNYVPDIFVPIFV
jgi:hypothetical protein